MSVKKCLCPKDHANIKNAVDKNKPMSMEKQKLAEKQERIFYDLNKNPDFQKSLVGLNKSKTVTAFQGQYAQNGVDVTRVKIKKMIANGVTVIKPSSIPMPKPTKVAVVIPKLPPKIVSVPKEVIPKVVPSKLPKKGVQFADSENQQIYDNLYNEFMADPKLKTIEDFAAKVEKTVSLPIRKAASNWRIDSRRSWPSALKVKAEKIETANLKTLFGTNTSKKKAAKIISFEKEMNNKDYLQMRALNQAYFDKNKIKKVELYRGTGGRSGKGLASKFRKVKKGDSFTIVDNSLTGYTSDISVASTFGPKHGGIGSKVVFDSKDIVIHSDLWPKDILGKRKYDEEEEFICIGGIRKIEWKDIFLDIQW